MTEDLLKQVPEKMRDTLATILKLTDNFCQEHLNEDYWLLAQKMAITICRKRVGINAGKGKPASWASGIIHALGMVNFLHDKNTQPYMSSSELSEGFGVSQGTMGTKSKTIRDILKISPMDPTWCLPDILEHNPLVWMFELNGFLIDMRTAPRELQEAAYAQGLIPFIPEDKSISTTEDEDENTDTTMTKKKTDKQKRKARLAKKRKHDLSRPRCGLCGATTNLTKTECCGNWICNDEDQYEMFSFSRNSCHRNHRRLTLCGYHCSEGHDGNWQDCQQCREDFDTEDYVDYGTNEYNFEKLKNPPNYEPTKCHKCGAVIVRADGGYSQSSEGFMCYDCMVKEHPDLYGM